MRAALLLAAALAGLLPTAEAASPRLVRDATVTWSEPEADFGGYSGLVVEDGGTRFLAVSDRGTWARGTLEREGGRIVAARLDSSGALHEISGRPLDDKNIDAEGLAVDAQGRAWVSFEAFHRVRRFDDIAGPATDVRPHRDFRRLQSNSGIEALAVGPDGTLYAIPERSGALDRPFPVYRLSVDQPQGRWDKRLKLRRDGSFLPVDADIGPDGDLYLLERDFGWMSGFATRIRRFELGPGGVEGEATLLETPFGELDNMEGMSVWRDSDGRTRVTLISDDNFFPLQRTIFVEYLLAGE
jgi:hypothetical protein